MDEAISQCNDDPNCAAIEDRWGSGKPPIGLCTKYKGKRAGAGTYLLQRGNYQFENEFLSRIKLYIKLPQGSINPHMPNGY